MDQAWLEGQNTYMLCSPARLAARWAEIESALASDDRGTRVTIVLPTGLPTGETAWRERLSRAGLSRRDLGEMGLASGDLTVSRGLEGVERALLPSGFEVWSGGKRRFPCAGATLDHDLAEKYMDPRDLGIGCEAKVKKAQRSYGYIPHDPSRWKGKGFSPYVEAVMTEGHRIEGPEPFGFYEVEQYKWRDADAQRMGGLEADRHVLAGALEYVPASEAQALLGSAATVHPWTVVFQKDKWRACQDYSTGTNMEADSAPFKLPTVFDVRNIIKKSSHFSKWDLRDGFFHVPIHPASRNRMLVRHPVSGLLMRCLRLCPSGTSTLRGAFAPSPRRWRRGSARGWRVWASRLTSSSSWTTPWWLATRRRTREQLVESSRRCSRSWACSGPHTNGGGQPK